MRSRFAVQTFASSALIAYIACLFLSHDAFLGQIALPHAVLKPLVAIDAPPVPMPREGCHFGGRESRVDAAGLNLQRHPAHVRTRCERELVERCQTIGSVTSPGTTK